ncbi:Phosphatidylinositol (PI) 3-kinase [Quaeritorhiza haematococci]|nr:Phosphatidylinositol (PI) 3-kinase [Quaeritorhiza haematococci]
MPISTVYHAFQNHWTWNEWITIPIKYRDLPLSTQLAFTVWDVRAPRRTSVLGSTTMSLFGKNNTLKKGKHKLYVWAFKETDGRVQTSTPSKINDSSDMDRLEKLMRKYDRGDIVHVDWMDHLAFREIEKINKHETMSSKEMFLYIDLPQFDFPLLFNEKEYTLPPAIHPRFLDSEIAIVADPETCRDNPVENKHRKLARSHRNGPLDRDLKPNAKIRDELNKILKYPPTKSLTAEEKDLLWKFRFYLTRDKKALTKFLKCVVWTDPIEVKQAVDLLGHWEQIDVEDALELLGPTFEHRSVRSYAVMQLQRADDDELQLYLLQLVQALKFEGISDRSAIHESPLAEFLIDRSIKNPILGNNFHWYLMVECEDKDKNVGRMYAKIAYQFMSSMMEIPEGMHRRDLLRRQGELVATLTNISKDLRLSKELRPKKIERLRSIIADPKNGLLSFPPMPLPLDPQVHVTGLIPEKATVFKSALMPLRLTFSCLDGSEYPVLLHIIFKTGDDLRQDQLVVQIITLMDKLLRKENLDLKLTPYKVLATGTGHGMVQFVQSMSLAAILSENSNSLLAFLQKYNSNKESASSNSYSIPASVMDTYVKSCGNLFHVDFGFILGRDPKPFPPPMKLCKEMVEAMGGANSTHHQKFKSYCFISFNSLRKSANLILNLFSLMVNANVADIAIEPDKAVLKVGCLKSEKK